MKKGRKVTAIILALAIIAYVICAVYLLITNPTDTYIIREGTISKEDEAIGYIIRDEIVVKDENNKNGIYAIASEGQRVGVEESIFRYYSDSEKEITTQIRAIDYQIQDILEQQKNPPSADIKAIENQIEEKIKLVNSINNYQAMTDSKKDIDNLISKKINFMGEVTENKEIKSLVKQRKQLETTLKSGSEYKTAPIGGVVSYRVDGLEETLSVDKFDQITEKYLNDLDLKTGKIISSSDECGKVIDNFKCYIAITMNSQNAKGAKVGDEVDLRISNNEEVEAEIIRINEENGKRTIIFETNKMSEDLINHRKIVVDVIWWDVSGLKVPKQAITQEKGLSYVTRNKAGIESKLLVKVKKQTDKFAIIEPYDNEELKELGFDADAIRNYRKVTNYDEIVIEY